MVIQKEINKIISELKDQHVSHLYLKDVVVSLHMYDSNSKLSLSSCVFDGINYIPKSVRLAINAPAPFTHYPIQTFFSVDEEGFQVFLCYIDEFDHIDSFELNETLEIFADKASAWKVHLDNKGKEDLVRIPVK